MSYNSNYPVARTRIVAAEMRDQFNALKTMYDDLRNDIIQMRLQLRDFLPGKAILTDAESQGPGQIHFGLTAEHYQTIDIYIKTPGASDYIVAVAGFTGAEFSMSNLDPGTYSFKAIARSFLDDGPESDPVELEVEA